MTDARHALVSCRSGRLMAVGAGFALLALGACSSAAPPTFDLSAPSQVPHATRGRGLLGVAEPVTVQALDSDRVIVKDAKGGISYLSGAQWADRLPRLVQSRLIETFENAGQVRNVTRPGGGVSPDRLLVTEIRSFEVLSATQTAEVSITAKIVSGSGRVLAGQVFQAQAPVSAVDGPSAAHALDAALSRVMVQIVGWAGGRG